METKEVFFTWKDVKRLFKRRKRHYIYSLIGAFLIVLILYLSQPVRYEATATFKQSAQDQQLKGQGELLLSVLQSAGAFSREEAAQPLLTSQTLIREVVETLGMQIQPKQFFVTRWIRNIKGSLCAELGVTLPEPNSFEFSSVHSETRKPIPFYLRFSSPDSFEIFNEKKQKQGEGYLGILVHYLGSSFQLDQAPKGVEKGKFYSFQIKSWIEIVKKTAAYLEVKSSKKDKNILLLKFSFPEAKKCSHFVNELMYAYQMYLKKENEEMAQLQMNYLEKRQSELMEKYEESLTSHMHFLDENLEGTGFMTLKQESEVLAKPSEEFLERLYDVDLQLSRLTSRKKDKKDVREKEIDSTEVDPLEKIYAKRHETLLQTDLKRKKAADRDMQNLLCFLDQKNPVPFDGKMPNGISTALLQGLEEVQKCCRNYNGDPLVFVEIQQKKQRLKKQTEEEWQSKLDSAFFYELEGVNPETVQKLYVEYNEQLDSLRVHAQQLTEVKERILLPEFEIASLSGLLLDAVSLEMIQKAGQKTLELQDKANYSSKDIERMLAGLDVQKRFLLQHIEQILSLQKLKIQLIEEKVDSLQQTSIHQLEVEKQLIQKQLVSLKERMKSFPGKWKRENELKMKRDLSLSVIEGLTQLTESKNIDSELFHVGSKPIDSAILPYKPQTKMAFTFSFLIALVFSLFLLTKDLVKWLSKGRVLTESFILSMGIAFCGFFKKGKRGSFQISDADEIETFRKICTFLNSSNKKNQGSSVLMLSESRLFDVEKVAFLLTLRGSKVLLVECFADSVCREPQQVGLYEYLSGSYETPTILKKEGFDWIPSGVYHTHFVEWLCLKKFSDLVQGYLGSYDFVLLSMRGKPTDASVEPLKALADLFILHVCDDVVWEDVSGWVHKKPSSLAVVFSEQ